MSEVDQDYEAEDEEDEAGESPAEILAAKDALAARCLAAGLAYEEISGADDEWRVRVGMKCGRDIRPVVLWSAEEINRLLGVPFETYVFLKNLEAICSYTEGSIEAAIRTVGPTLGIPSGVLYRRLFGGDRTDSSDLTTAKIHLDPQQDGLPGIEISQPSEAFDRLSRLPMRNKLTLKLTGCHVTTHDAALALLQKISGSVFFQIDLLSSVPLALERERRRAPVGRRARHTTSAADLQYPRTQFDNAPLSLYSYARSAAGMPLLQFLAFYQVVEFYFPIYSQSEAQRRLKAILKDPAFRGDRDADIARLLASIQVSRSGAFGDERAQLRATLLECTDSESLRQFLEHEDRREFFQTKSKNLPYHKLPISNLTADLRGDVAERIYDIRCKIVHTKSDSRDGAVELLLPFSPEAEQLSFDIELGQYLAQQVMIASSMPLNVHG